MSESIVNHGGSSFESPIVVESRTEGLVVDSRLIADNLGIHHKNLMETIRKHQAKIEQRFGVITFETWKLSKSRQGGRPEKFAWLTEDQSMFVMTLSRNTDRVMECKANLVEAFGNARRQQSAPSLPSDYIEALQALIASEKQKALMAAEQKLLKEENRQLSEAVDELFEYSSIVRIAKFNGMNEKAFDWRKLKAASLALGQEVKRVPCPRFETKLLYPHDAWRFCYPEVKLPETLTLRLPTA
ncbi:Rha family transcriptional regulator [Synechocystis sp. LEGE 06083]|uniref:Rha family transcriptional regulator n=1 Tax=Synechocystis sp. LEGE 06083 TaxID=915336 RepID=UPI00188082E5|nr:Rha family transcriptional regulator [Synechocystis sp. LEGE 06083]MBE9194223.1 Rha family transcriptional regulator [Synechocystis sp. LEGE 06083]